MRDPPTYEREIEDGEGTRESEPEYVDDPEVNVKTKVVKKGAKKRLMRQHRVLVGTLTGKDVVDQSTQVEKQDRRRALLNAQRNTVTGDCVAKPRDGQGKRRPSLLQLIGVGLSVASAALLRGWYVSQPLASESGFDLNTQVGRAEADKYIDKIKRASALEALAGMCGVSASARATSEAATRGWSQP